MEYFNQSYDLFKQLVTQHINILFLNLKNSVHPEAMGFFDALDYKIKDPCNIAFCLCKERAFESDTVGQIQ